MLLRLPHRRLCCAWLLGSALGLPARAADTTLAVIGAPGSAGAALSLDELALVYRRRKQFIGSQRVQPVNLPATHALRRWFSQQVLRQTPEELEDYWRDQYFNGISPPFVLASEEAVLRFVAATPGAIGYVSHCLVDRRVAVLALLEGGPACGRAAGQDPRAAGG